MVVLSSHQDRTVSLWDVETASLVSSIKPTLKSKKEKNALNFTEWNYAAQPQLLFPLAVHYLPVFRFFLSPTCVHTWWTPVSDRRPEGSGTKLATLCTVNLTSADPASAYHKTHTRDTSIMCPFTADALCRLHVCTAHTRLSHRTHSAVIAVIIFVACEEGL